jgi:cytochrome b involved in lipid metabolism
VRRIVYTAFVAFWTAVVTIALIDHRDDDRSPAPAPLPMETRFKLTEVSRHDQPDDCWMAIEGGVYDLTQYVPRHPAPRHVLTKWCGREATEGMRNKVTGRDHSERAWRQLERYRIGSLAGD